MAPQPDADVIGQGMYYDPTGAYELPEDSEHALPRPMTSADQPSVGVTPFDFSTFGKVNYLGLYQLTRVNAGFPTMLEDMLYEIASRQQKCKWMREPLRISFGGAGIFASCGWPWDFYIRSWVLEGMQTRHPGIQNEQRDHLLNVRAVMRTGLKQFERRKRGRRALRHI